MSDQSKCTPTQDLPHDHAPPRVVWPSRARRTIGRGPWVATFERHSEIGTGAL